MDEVLISVAPVAATAAEADPEKIAREVIACAREGAGMVHLHVRNRNGRLTARLDAFHETVRLIRAGCDIVIEASTGGVSDLTIAERCAPLSLPEVECASLNVGSVNLGDAVYLNSPADVEYCLTRILEVRKTPEVEVFEIGMIATTLALWEKYKVAVPPLFSIVLGHRGASPATPEALLALRSFIPKTAHWGITHYGRQNNDVIAAAVALGAQTVRVGFEDSAVTEAGKQAADNLELVRHFAGLLRAMGKRPMSGEQARSVFEIV